MIDKLFRDKKFRDMGRKVTKVFDSTKFGVNFIRVIDTYGNSNDEAAGSEKTVERYTVRYFMDKYKRLI